MFLLASECLFAEPSAADKELLEQVSKKLIAVTDPVAGFEWPPDFQVIDNPEINAFATIQRRDEKTYPIIRVFSGMMSQVIKGDEDLLALILGHEIGHITKRPILFNAKRDRTEFLRTSFCRDEEIEADIVGAELMLKAGFNLKNGVKYIQRMNDLGLKYSSLEGLGLDHPSWNDRLAKIDKSRARLWKTMSAFDNGVELLFVEQYALAEECFERVLLEFPECDEAWVNLGNARLMRYFDKLDLDDIKDYGVGHVMTPGFYLRADSIPTRGRDDKLWKKAVAALNKALELKKDLTLARSNLGLTYLFHPEGKDVAKATEYMQAAVDDAILDGKFAPFHRATILLNLGVAYFAADDEEKGNLYVDRAVDISPFSMRGGKLDDTRMIPSARNYTVASVLAKRKTDKDAKIARSKFQRYLKTTNSSSIYWEAAYDQFKGLSKKLGIVADPKESFKPDLEPLRPVLSHTLKSGMAVKLTDEFADVQKKLGSGTPSNVIAGASLKRVRYFAEGIELLVNDSVIAICVVSADAAPITLRGKGPASNVSLTLKVGMPALEVEKALGEGEKCNFTDPFVEYVYYRSQGVAVRNTRGRVTEVVVASLPASDKR